jgi:hypothetical protein
MDSITKKNWWPASQVEKNRPRGGSDKGEFVVFRKILTVIIAAAGLSAGPASAASISYFLDLSNDLPDGENYLQVTISDSTTVAGDIDFEIVVLGDAYPEALANFGMQSFFFNAAEGLNIEADNIVGIDPEEWAVSFNKSAGGGFGKYSVEVAGVGSVRTQSLSFSITGITGDTINSYALGNEFLPNGSSEFFAAHVADYDSAPQTGGKFGGSSVVPIPASAWLMMSGLGFLGFMRYKQKQ